MSSATNAAAAKILLVEDSETQALELRLLLEAQGFAVDRSATAEAALDHLNECLPDLVVADYHLPGMNGDEFTRQMRLSLRTRALPVLMLTGAQGGERQGLESGADAYIAKSADRDLLILRIRALLRERRSGRGSSPGGATFRRGRILVIDGSATYRTFFVGLLSQEGHAVATAGSREEALAALQASDAHFDCVTIDLLGHAYDGIALCREIAEHRKEAAESGDDTRIAAFQLVGIAGNAPSKALLMEAFAAGADDVIAKSDGDVLALRVRGLVRRRLLDEDNRRITLEFGASERALERARAETEAAETRAALADALEQANQDLAEANRRLTDTQAQLVQAAKMASLGELVAGIAHEINNPLAFIQAHQGTVETWLGELPDQGSEAAQKKLDKARARVATMRAGLQRIQELVKNLRTFSRLDEGERTMVHVPEAVETVLTLIQHKLGDRITVVRDFSGNVDMHCTPALLNQVVMNIVSNAADAIAGPGTITLSTRTEGDMDVIRISDTGPGIPEPLRERVFEPFFTTKAVGSGTGLGLAIAYSVVRAHSGTLTIEAAQGGGACFVIGIPRPAASS